MNRICEGKNQIKSNANEQCQIYIFTWIQQWHMHDEERKKVTKAEYKKKENRFYFKCGFFTSYGNEKIRKKEGKKERVRQKWVWFKTNEIYGYCCIIT